MSTPTDGPARHREVLRAPVSWWLLVGFFLVSVLVSVGFYLGWLQGLVATAVLGAVAVWVVVDLGRLVVVADEQGLRAGPALVGWEWIGGVRALDREQTRQRLGPRADARAHLATRPYLDRSVEVTIDDPADPHPYWLVSTRDPQHLVAAVEAGMARHGHGQRKEQDA